MGLVTLFDGKSAIEFANGSITDMEDKDIINAFTEGVKDFRLISSSTQAEFTITAQEMSNEVKKLCGVAADAILPSKIEFEGVVGFTQARRHKKKRINKKWLKRYGMIPVYGTKTGTITDIQQKTDDNIGEFEFTIEDIKKKED